MNETNNNQQTPEIKKEPIDKKLILIGIAALIIVITIVIVLILPNGGNTEKPIDPVNQKIELVGKDLENGKILVTVNSTKTNVHDVSFKLSFYDENNEFMRSFSDKIFGVSKDKPAYHIVDTAGLIKGKYTFKFEITEETEIPNEKIFSDKFTAKSEVQDNKILVQFENHSGTEVDSVQVGVLYYNANEPVAYTSQYSLNVGANYILNETVYIPTDAVGTPIRFDRHEVIITAYDN